MYSVAFIAVNTWCFVIDNALHLQNDQLYSNSGSCNVNIIVCHLCDFSWCKLQLDEFLTFDKTKMILTDVECLNLFIFLHFTCIILIHLLHMAFTNICVIIIKYVKSVVSTVVLQRNRTTSLSNSAGKCTFQNPGSGI